MDVHGIILTQKLLVPNAFKDVVFREDLLGIAHKQFKDKILSFGQGNGLVADAYLHCGTVQLYIFEGEDLRGTAAAASPEKGFYPCHQLVIVKGLADKIVHARL